MLNIEKTIQYNYISYIRYFKNKFDTNIESITNKIKSTLINIKERAIEKRLRQVKLAPRKHIYE